MTRVAFDLGALRRGSFPALVLLAATLYAAYGVESPFLPAFLGERGLTPGDIGLVLAAGTLARLASGPLAGHLADRHAAARGVLGVAALAAGVLAFAYLAGAGFWSFLAVSVVHAVAIGPLAPLADSLALAAAARERHFAYGWFRGAGSGAFILGTLAAGPLVARAGLAAVIVACGVLFLALAASTRLVPPAQATGEREALPGWHGLRALLADPAYRNVVIVAALVIGSHALHDAFAVIRWRAAGLSADTVGLLWSEAVLAEVAVFLLIGPPLLARLGPAPAAALAAVAGILRWGVMASTAAVPALALIQPLHGLTFALLHLAAMRIIAERVPAARAATAQTLYGTFGLGLASAVLTALAGLVYARLGPASFWLMALLCLAALPFVAALGRALRAPPPREGGPA